MQTTDEDPRADAPPAPAGGEVVRCVEVSKVYSGAGTETFALDATSLNISRGEFVSLIGPSGCGKTTLLNIIAGLVPATTGEVTVNGDPVTGPRRETGVMFQGATLLPWRTTLDNILLPIEVRSGKRAAREQADRARELLAMTGLEGFESSYPHELSGGMAQRAAICRMLITEPDLLLLDEPFGALDELTRDAMNVELQRICRERAVTAIMVTHSIHEAVFMSDRIYVMRPRPGRVTDTIEIDLDYPRDYLAENDARFNAYVTDVRKALSDGAA